VVDDPRPAITTHGIDDFLKEAQHHTRGHAVQRVDQSLRIDQRLAGRVEFQDGVGRLGHPSTPNKKRFSD
jgi:hypothetical protein